MDLEMNLSTFSKETLISIINILNHIEQVVELLML